MHKLSEKLVEKKKKSLKFLISSSKESLVELKSAKVSRWKWTKSKTRRQNECRWIKQPQRGGLQKSLKDFPRLCCFAFLKLSVRNFLSRVDPLKLIISFIVCWHSLQQKCTLINSNFFDDNIKSFYKKKLPFELLMIRKKKPFFKL